MSGNGLLSAHATSWYDDARYRLSWLVLPQAVTALVAVIAFAALSPSGDWGKPAVTKESEKEAVDLREKAGNEGDKTAFEALKKRADEGDIAARSLLGGLYDPDFSASYPKNPVQPDAAIAMTLYRQAADLGFPGGQRGMAQLSLAKAYGQYDLKRGCKYGASFYANPVASRQNYFSFWDTLFLLAPCFVDTESGVARDLPKAAEIYLAAVAGKNRQAIGALTTDLGKQPPDLIAALQANLAKRGLYPGRADGKVNTQTIGAVYTLGGQSPPPGGAASPPNEGARPAPPIPAPPASAPQSEATQPSFDNVWALFGRAKTNAAEEAKLHAYADGGSVAAQLLYATLLNPNVREARMTATDAGRAASYYERAAAAGLSEAAASVAFLYDIGFPNLPRDTAKAAHFAFRSLELKGGTVLSSLEKDTWHEGFWSSLQTLLAERKLYAGAIVDRRTDRSILAARKLARGE